MSGPGLVELIRVEIVLRQGGLLSRIVVARTLRLDGCRVFRGHPGEYVRAPVVALLPVYSEYLDQLLLPAITLDVEVGRQADVPKKLVRPVHRRMHQHDETACLVGSLYRLDVSVARDEVVAVGYEKQSVRRLSVIGKKVYAVSLQVESQSFPALANIVGSGDHRMVVAPPAASSGKEDGEGQEHHRRENPAEIPPRVAIFHSPYHLAS